MLSFALLKDIQNFINAHFDESKDEEYSNSIRYSLKNLAEPSEKAPENNLEQTDYNPDNDFPIPTFLQNKNIILSDESYEIKKEDETSESDAVLSLKDIEDVIPQDVDFSIVGRTYPQVEETFNKSSTFDTFKSLQGIEELEEDDDSFSGEAIHYGKDIALQENQQRLIRTKVPKVPPVKNIRKILWHEDVEEYLRKEDESFGIVLTKLIDAAGITDAECYHRAQISRSHFNKIKNDPNYRVQKETVMAFILALNLNLEEASDLLSKAGYSFATNSKFDLIIMYCIEHKIYDVIEVNQILYSFDQKLLGAGIRNENVSW